MCLFSIISPKKANEERRGDVDMVEKKLHKGVWTKSELDLLIKLFPDYPTAEIAAQLGRPNIAVKKKASRIGLRKSEQRLKSIGRNIRS